MVPQFLCVLTAPLKDNKQYSNDLEYILNNMELIINNYNFFKYLISS